MREDLIPETNWLKIKNTLHDVVLSSTSHGLPNIFKSKRILLKIIWTLFFLISLGYCSFSIIKTINSYFNWEYLTKIEDFRENPTEFPAITVCNLNKYGNEFAKNVSNIFYPSLQYNSKFKTISELFLSLKYSDINFQNSIDDENREVFSILMNEVNNNTPVGLLNNIFEKKISNNKEIIYGVISLKDIQTYFDPNNSRAPTALGTSRNGLASRQSQQSRHSLLSVKSSNNINNNKNLRTQSRNSYESLDSMLLDKNIDLYKYSKQMTIFFCIEKESNKIYKKDKEFLSQVFQLLRDQLSLIEGRHLRCYSRETSFYNLVKFSEDILSSSYPKNPTALLTALPQLPSSVYETAVQISCSNPVAVLTAWQQLPSAVSKNSCSCSDPKAYSQLGSSCRF